MQFIKRTGRYCGYVKLTIFVLLAISSLLSCRDRTRTDFSAALSYSADTILFDTIFTSQGTRTLSFMARNSSDGKIIVSRMYLDGGSSSSYVVNADGEMLLGETNFEIAPNDSIYIFVQAKLKEQGADTAIKHQEHLILQYNGYTDKIPVISFGQDVTRIYGKSIGTEHWTSKKPILLYDSLHIQKGHTLTIDPGITIYCHAKTRIIAEGDLICNGTKEEPVVFRSDNLDTSYRKIPNQWGSIILKNNAGTYSFTHTTIREATNGLLSLQDNYSADMSVRLANAKIAYCGFAGIAAHNTNIEATNCLFSQCGWYGLSISGNGQHSYIHATVSKEEIFVNFNDAAPYVKLQDSAISEHLDVYFGNSIISGSEPKKVAIKFPDDSITNWSATFDYCAVAADESDFEKDYFRNCKRITDTSTLFIHASKPPLLLEPGSVARNIGSLEITGDLLVDYLGHERTTDAKPDAGAYEYFPYEDED